jgi:hypothetical protein
MRCAKCKAENVPGICGAPLTAEAAPAATRPLKEVGFREKLREIAGGIQEAVKGKNLAEMVKTGKIGEITDRLKSIKIFDDRMDPLTNMIIVFLAWGILNFVGFFRIAALVLTFLSGPAGIVVLLVLTYVYSTNRVVIHEKVEEMRKGESLRKR